MNQEHFLHTIFKGAKFTKEQLDLIIPNYRRVAFLKNDFLLHSGKTANHYWFIEQGYIRSFAVDTEGNDISTNFYTAGDIVIDWPSFFLRSATRETIQALSDCVCWQIDFESFQKLFHTIEPFREQGRTNLVESYFGLKNKSVAMITDPAKDRYKALVKNKPEIILNVSLRQIATYLGITDTSLSRIRKEIAAEK